MVRVCSLDIEVVTGDITELDVDAIVNAANSDLWMGAGVAGAIKRKGGTEIEREAMSKGPIEPGEAVITGAGRLRARYVIHCAGMPPGRPATVNYVRSSVSHAMELAKEHGVSEIAFPAIGAGVGGLSVNESAQAILEGLRAHCDDPGPVRRVLLVGYTADSAKALESVLTDFAQGE